MRTNKQHINVRGGASSRAPSSFPRGKSAAVVRKVPSKITTIVSGKRPAARHAYGHEKHPFNMNVQPILKQYPIASANYTPTLAVPTVIDLISALAPGDSDNTRLGDSVISDYLEMRAVCANVVGSATGPGILQDVQVRVLICGSLDPTPGANPLISNDPTATIDNSRSPSEVYIFWDSGVFNLTPAFGGNGTAFATATSFSQIYHNVHSINKHVKLHKHNVGGMYSQFNGATLINGAFYALVLSNYVTTTVYGPRIRIGLSTGFHDYVPDLEASMSARLTRIEQVVAKDDAARMDEIEAKVSQLRHIFLKE